MTSATLQAPPRLARGSTLAVVSPASDAAARYPVRLERGVRALRDHGFEVVVMPNARKTAWGGTAGTAAERAADLMTAFADPSIDGIVATVGGRLSSQLLPLLDYETIATHPKVVCGYSDVTALHCALGKNAGLQTFYGPAVMPDWAELTAPAPEMAECFLRMTTSADAYGLLPDPRWEIAEFVDWADDRERATAEAPAIAVLRDGAAEGRLVGGCLPVLCELLGTPWFPEVDRCVLLLEYPQSPYTPAHAASNLWHLRNAGVFDRAAAVIIGRPHLGRDRPIYDGWVRTALVGRAIPAVSGVACGHTIPNLTLPLGAIVRVDGAAVSILTPTVS